MSVYVDDMRAGFGRMTMCHMIADSTEELLAMADRIGVQRKWIQKAGTIYEHFDVCLAKRKLAIAAGATEITMRDLGLRLKQRREQYRSGAGTRTGSSSGNKGPDNKGEKGSES